MRFLMIDGMLSGTGVRDSRAGGYLDPKEVGLSVELIGRIEKWLSEYETAHYHDFKNEAENHRLDLEGIEITRQARAQLPGSKVEYFSNARMQRITL